MSQSQPRKTFRTEKGTELPLLNLKGKEYLQVMHRLVWFRERYPNGVIKTQMIETNGEGKDRYYIFRAEVYIDTERGPMLVATGHKRETVGDFADALEKAESGATGRALALMGIGTAFAHDDLDEGMRLADSPAPVVATATPVATVSSTTTETPTRRASFRKNLTANGADTTSTSDDI